MGMDLGGGGGKKGQSSPDMNVTPLVDVVLVLLIIFMVITPLLAKQFWVIIPPKPDEEEQEPPPEPDPDREPPIVVTIDAEGIIRINRERVTLDQMPPRIRRMLASRQDRGLGQQVFFDAADDAPYASAVEVLDRIRAAGLDPDQPTEPPSQFAIIVSTSALPIPSN